MTMGTSLKLTKSTTNYMKICVRNYALPAGQQKKKPDLHLNHVSVAGHIHSIPFCISVGHKTKTSSQCRHKFNLPIVERQNQYQYTFRLLF